MTTPSANPDASVVTDAITEIWESATNAVCQRMQDMEHCACPAGDCLAAKVDMSDTDRSRFEAALASPSIAGAVTEEMVYAALDAFNVDRWPHSDFARMDRALTAALRAQPAQAGWVTVPREPT